MWKPFSVSLLASGFKIRSLSIVGTPALCLPCCGSHEACSLEYRPTVQTEAILVRQCLLQGPVRYDGGPKCPGLQAPDQRALLLGPAGRQYKRSLKRSLKIWGGHATPYLLALCVRGPCPAGTHWLHGCSVLAGAPCVLTVNASNQVCCAPAHFIAVQPLLGHRPLQTRPAGCPQAASPTAAAGSWALAAWTAGRTGPP